MDEHRISPQTKPPEPQRSPKESIVGVETQPKLPVCLAETLGLLSTALYLVDVCPTILLEDLNQTVLLEHEVHSRPFSYLPISCGQLWSFLIPSPTNPDEVEYVT